MKTKATVIAVNGMFATVETERTSACEGCHKNADGEKGCAVCTLVGNGNGKLTATAENSLNACVGDRVTVETPAPRVLGYAALVFLLPLLTCAAGALIAYAFTRSVAWCVAGAAIGFVAAFAGLRIYSGLLRKKRPDVVITEIISSAAERKE